MVLIVRTAELSAKVSQLLDTDVDGWVYEDIAQSRVSVKHSLQLDETDDEDGPLTSLEIESFDKEVDL